VSGVRRFTELPANARRYVAAMIKSVVDIAYADNLPAADKLPNLRYLGVGPLPSQIIKDVPATIELLQIAK
jgi:adenylosuccinate synthase